MPASKPSIYIPFVRNHHDQYFIKSVLDQFQWGEIVSIEMTQQERHRTAIINFKEWTYNLTQLFNHLKYYDQLKLNYSVYEFWWIKKNIFNTPVPKNLTIVNMPLVINVCLDPDYDSDTDSEDEN